MPYFRYRITPCSAFGSPLQSDTLLGHMLWAARLLDGEARVSELIEGFANGKPPFLISSAFPKGMLPMPNIVSPSREEFKRFLEKRKEFDGSLYRALTSYKRFKKMKYVPLESFTRYQECLDMIDLFACWLDDPDAFMQSHEIKEYQSHNSINRSTGTVLDEGGLYFSKAVHYQPASELDIYVFTDDVALFERFFDYLADTGYGADRSTGKGVFTYRKDDRFDDAIFKKKLPGAMTLSLCSNMNMAGFSGTYATITKYGKVWTGLGERNPFKKPFLAFVEGSLFSSMPSEGYVLRNIHADPKVVQITMPLTIPAGVEVRCDF